MKDLLLGLLDGIIGFFRELWNRYQQNKVQKKIEKLKEKHDELYLQFTSQYADFQRQLEEYRRARELQRPTEPVRDSLGKIGETDRGPKGSDR